jgi:carbon monoxide dehydrogenase subunit G
MQYTTEIEINAPVEKIAGLLGDHEQMKKWLRELKSYQPIEGEPKQEGSKTLLTINVAGGMEVTETIIAVEYPNHFATHYEMQGGTFIADSKLEATGEQTTKYILEHKFEFTGPLKLVSGLLKPSFIKHSERVMNDFRELAEGKMN